jgi:hypothetical protein
MISKISPCISIYYCFYLYRWWKELDVHSTLPYARERIEESCFWDMGAYFEPQYSAARNILTKLVIIITCIDDTYDAYGTIDELELFTKAIQRLVSTSSLSLSLKLNIRDF